MSASLEVRPWPAVQIPVFGKGGHGGQRWLANVAGGAWGTALAMHAARMGHNTLLYAREPQVSKDINDPDVKENTVYLKASRVPHKPLPDGCVGTCCPAANVSRWATSLACAALVQTPYSRELCCPVCGT